VGGGSPGFLQGGAVQAVLLEKLPEGHFGDAEPPGISNEIDQLVAIGLGMGEEKLGDRAGMARQELPVRATAKVLLNLLGDLGGGEVPMAERGPGADADEARNLSYPQSHAATEQEMTGDSGTGIVSGALLEELECCIKDGPLLIAQSFRGHLRLSQPLLERRTFLGHGNASLAIAFPAAEV
jgi:hypothetical protein